jgi:4-hydroxybenzoate polyprenyltransferase
VSERRALPLRAASLADALSRSCHPAPTVAVTCFATALAGAAGNTAATCVLLAVAVLAGQLSIGWSNDRMDAERDRSARRDDKPLATGELAARTADIAIGVALLSTVGFSLSLGWRAGLVHLAAVGCGWLYNVWLKATWFSWLPYAAAFAALPAIATLALPGPAVPAGWVVLTAALMGLAANLTNALPDLDGDRMTGISGLPHRIGAGASLVSAAVLLVAATASTAFGPPGTVTPFGWAVLAVSVVAVPASAVVAARDPASRGSFYGIIAVAGLDLVLIIVAGHSLR